MIITVINASATLVISAFLKEWITILLSVRARVSRVRVFSAPRSSINARNEAPLNSKIYVLYKHVKICIEILKAM